jgi:hypothetical protein
MFRNQKSSWVILLLLAGCQSYDRSPGFTLINRSDKLIRYWVSCDSAFKDMQMKNENRLKPHDSIMPYLLWGPEGKGPDKNPWVNAINRGDDSALHVFYYYVDYDGDPDRSDTLYHLIMRRCDYTVDSLVKLKWRVEYNQ